VPEVPETEAIAHQAVSISIGHKKMTTAVKTKHFKFFLSEDKQYLIQETFCPDPMIAIRMHEHQESRGHLIKVISGSLFIHDDADWQVTLNAGETLDVMHVHLKHEILSTENNTIFQNLTPIGRFSEEEIEELIQIDTQNNP
jgi:hypothetical protein